MLISKHEYRAAASAERARRRMMTHGHFAGLRLWTEREDNVVRRLYPDYRALRKKLSWRTYGALRHRVRSLGIQRRKLRWTAAEIARLRHLYRKSSMPVLLQAFPGRSKEAIKSQALARGLKRERRYAETGHDLLDAVRNRCAQLGYSMVDLDQISRTRRYFQKAGWCPSGSVNVARVAKAALALDGELGVRW